MCRRIPTQFYRLWIQYTSSTLQRNSVKGLLFLTSDIYYKKYFNKNIQEDHHQSNVREHSFLFFFCSCFTRRKKEKKTYVCMYACKKKRNVTEIDSLTLFSAETSDGRKYMYCVRRFHFNHIKLVNVQNYFKIKGNLAAMVNYVRRQAKSNNKSKRDNKGYYFGKKVIPVFRPPLHQT